MKEYDELKKELKEIAQILKGYPESLQSDVFNLLSKAYMGNLDLTDIKKSNDVSTNKKVVKKPKNNASNTTSKQSKDTTTNTPKKRSSSSKDSYKIVKTLNLKGDAKNPSLQKFCETKITKSSIKFNVVASYYLKKILNIDNVTPDHIYSCYKEMNIKVPTRLVQSLRDTAGSKYGYLDTSDINNIKVPVTGENFLEHDLIKKPKK